MTGRGGVRSDLPASPCQDSNLSPEGALVAGRRRGKSKVSPKISAEKMRVRNRRAQKAFRSRQKAKVEEEKKYICILQEKVQELEERVQELEEANSSLRSRGGILQRQFDQQKARWLTGQYNGFHDANLLWTEHSPMPSIGSCESGGEVANLSLSMAWYTPSKETCDIIKLEDIQPCGRLSECGNLDWLV